MPLVEGTRPILTKYKYDSQGKKLKERESTNPYVTTPVEEQSFFSKYWKILSLHSWFYQIYLEIMNKLVKVNQQLQAADSEYNFKLVKKLNS